MDRHEFEKHYKAMYAAKLESFGMAYVIEEFLVEKGRGFDVAPSQFLEPGQPKQCFRNAALAAFEWDGLTYCEGVASSKVISGLALDHAWVIDKEGRVLDPTWDDPHECAYFGVSIPTDILRKEIARTGVYGLFDTGCGPNFDFLENHFRWQSVQLSKAGSQRSSFGA